MRPRRPRPRPPAAAPSGRRRSARTSTWPSTARVSVTSGQGSLVVCAQPQPNPNPSGNEVFMAGARSGSLAVCGHCPASQRLTAPHRPLHHPPNVLSFLPPPPQSSTAWTSSPTRRSCGSPRSRGRRWCSSVPVPRTLRPQAPPPLAPFAPRPWPLFAALGNGSGPSSGRGSDH